ncbi:Uncharacterised protein [uncultured archaeon]|nr:Uncharacterised protein [uncultured archaeon]
MSIKQYVILIVLFIFLVNTAGAQASYVSVTLTPGEESSRTLSFTGAYKRLFATADASGTAASWVTPRRIDFGAIDPAETIKQDYYITVPASQTPGYYELVWKYSCKYTDGSTCTVASDTVLKITVEAQPAQTSAGGNEKALTIAQGEELTDYLTFSARSDEYGLSAWAYPSGTAASWVTPQYLDFGVIQPGDSVNKYYTITVTQDQRPGYYELDWTWGCGYTSGASCKPLKDVTVVQITVDANSRLAYVPTYTSYYNPATSGSNDAVMMGVIVFIVIFLVLLIIWIYIIIWVARDANKRGKSGAFWGLLTFFLGLLGLIIYLMARPGGNIVPCNFCKKEKLETLPQCPHCKNLTTPAYRPAPAPTVPPRPSVVQKHEAAVDTSKQQEKLNKINALLEKLDEKLAQGEITEARYTELREQYTDEADKLKNQITEKELMKEVGL